MKLGQPLYRSEYVLVSRSSSAGRGRFLCGRLTRWFGRCLRSVRARDDSQAANINVAKLAREIERA
jgi:hypothetical protein